MRLESKAKRKENNPCRNEATPKTSPAATQKLTTMAAELPIMKSQKLFMSREAKQGPRHQRGQTSAQFPHQNCGKDEAAS